MAVPYKTCKMVHDSMLRCNIPFYTGGHSDHVTHGHTDPPGAARDNVVLTDHSLRVACIAQGIVLSAAGHDRYGALYTHAMGTVHTSICQQDVSSAATAALCSLPLRRCGRDVHTRLSTIDTRFL
eukprot:1065743-Amphidinium_carterae.1